MADATTSILGHRVVRREDPALLTGAGRFVADVDVPGAAHAVFVRSQVAHGRIVGIDLEDARAAPAVVGVFAASDLALDDLDPPMPALDSAMRRPLLARDVVRFVGEAVAVVVAETEAAAVDAAELVVVDIEPLDPVVDVASSREGGPKLFARAESNVALTVTAREPIDFDDCEVVVELAARNQRLAAAPIEARVAAARWEGGRLTHWASSQGSHAVRDELARVLDVDPALVRVITADVGGGFGAKGSPSPEELLVAVLARAVGRPVRWAETRTESLAAMVQGRDQHQAITVGGTRDGIITAYRLHVTQDAGAYPLMGAVLPFMTRHMLTGVYAIERAEFASESVVTTTAPVAAYRGAGRPEAAAAIERAVDAFAAECDLDPAEVRRRNFVPADAFPYTTPTRTVYDSGDYERALDRALEHAGYDALRAEQARRRAAGDPSLLGIGLASYVEVTAFGAGGEYGSVALQPDGRVRAVTGSTPYGQGHQTAWAMLVAERLGVDLDRVDVVFGDTDLVPEGAVTGGSRSVQLAGSSMWSAATALAEQAREVAADLLEAAVDDVVLDAARGAFHVAGTPARTIGWDEVAAGAPEPLVGRSDFAQERPTYPFGAHVAVVEVDAETGHVRLVRLVAVDDAGTILNPLLATGQVHGGLAQGTAQALFEEVRYDDDGNPLTTTFLDYAVPSAAELPSFERVEMETPTPLNPLGAKGIGESGTIGSTPAVQNAVVDALSHLGVRHLDLPCTPERVWRAIRDAT